jgi:hypothetical protein
MGELDFLKNVSPQEAMQTLDDMREGQLAYKKHVRENSSNYKDYADFSPVHGKYNRKVYSIPAIVYWSDPKKWEEVSKSKKLQKKYPEWAVKS